MSLDLILRTALTGGTDGALDNYSVASCETGKPALAFVVGTGFVPYIYDETEAGAESSPDIIIPDDNASGTGAWVLADLYYGTASFTDITASGGIYLGGSAAANYLDDYEEGDWTPVLEGSTTAGTHSYSSQAGYYCKIGTIVHLWFQVDLSSLDGGAAGNIYITGKPFTVSNATSNTVTLAPLTQMDTYPAGFTGFAGRAISDGIQLGYSQSEGSISSGLDISYLSSSSRLRGHCSYITT